MLVAMHHQAIGDRPMANVDLTKDDATRVKVFFQLVNDVVEDLQSQSAVEEKWNIKTFH